MGEPDLVEEPDLRRDRARVDGVVRAHHHPSDIELCAAVSGDANPTHLDEAITRTGPA